MATFQQYFNQGSRTEVRDGGQIFVENLDTGKMEPGFVTSVPNTRDFPNDPEYQNAYKAQVVYPASLAQQFEAEITAAGGTPGGDAKQINSTFLEDNADLLKFAGIVAGGSGLLNSLAGLSGAGAGAGSEFLGAGEALGAETLGAGAFEGVGGAGGTFLEGELGGLGAGGGTGTETFLEGELGGLGTGGGTGGGTGTETFLEGELGGLGTGGGTGGAGAGGGLLGTITTLLDKVLGGDLSGIDELLKLGIPAALLAGLFEENKGPLDDALTSAGNAAVQHAGAFAAMPALQQTPTQKRAIELANENVGAWKPYIDKADTLFADYAKGVAGVDLDKYMNPYLDEVLKNSLRDIEESAAKRGQELRAITSRSGNDFRSSVDGGNRYNIEDSLLDRERLRTIGDTSAKVHAGAFDTAWANAGRDVDRMGIAGTNYSNLGKTVGALGDSDVTSLTSAGALEQQPQRDALSKAAANVDVYRSIIPGTSQAAAAARDPSMLSNVVGALGAYNTLNKIGVGP